MRKTHESRGVAIYDLHRLRLLRELSYRGTLAAVAEALGYSPSAVSRQLSILEREVKASLLEPAGRGVRLTPAAITLVGHTEAILRELEEAAATIAAGLTDISGTVRLATFQTAAHTLVLEVIDHLASTHPHLVVPFTQLSAEAAIPALLSHDFDLVLSENYPGHPPARHPGVMTQTIAEDPLLLATPAEHSQGSLGALAEASWVMEPHGTAARAWSESVCRAAGFEPRVQYETSDLGLHALLVARGHAAAFLPRLSCQPSPEIRLTSTGDTRTITASSRTGSENSPAIKAVRDALATH